MSGKRLYNFREGDRSEYLAVFGLSRIAFVTPVPRQEDFGVVDLRCVLARKENNSVFPNNAFNVQVKSNLDTIRLDENQIRWITTMMNCPFFICLVDKKKQRLKIYSCTRIWLALFLRMTPKEIKLHLDEDGPECHYKFSQPDPNDIDGEFDVYLGLPILDLKINQLENDPNIAFGILDSWIRLDIGNICRMRIGRCAVRHYSKWQSNIIPICPPIETYYHRPPEQHELNKEIIPFLISLGMSYKRFGYPKQVLAICELLQALDPVLNDRQRIWAGTQFAEIPVECIS